MKSDSLSHFKCSKRTQRDINLTISKSEANQYIYNSKGVVRTAFQHIGDSPEGKQAPFYVYRFQPAARIEHKWIRQSTTNRINILLISS